MVKDGEDFHGIQTGDELDKFRFSTNASREVAPLKVWIFVRAPELKVW